LGIVFNWSNFYFSKILLGFLQILQVLNIEKSNIINLLGSLNIV